jgi:hypothetical protein
MDYIFSRGGGLMAGDAEVVGGERGDRSTPPGFWPSVHVGLRLPAASQQRPVTIAMFMGLAQAMALDTVGLCPTGVQGWPARPAAGEPAPEGSPRWLGPRRRTESGLGSGGQAMVIVSCGANISSTALAQAIAAAPAS